MNKDLWRWADPDGQQRKVRLDELRAALAGGHIAPNTPVWRSGWTDWQSAGDVPELTSASVGGANGVVLNIPPPPLAMVAVQQEYEQKSESLAPSPSLPPVAASGAEPPPPPRYVPLAVIVAPPMQPSSGNLKTMVGGSSASVQIVPPQPPPEAPRVPPVPAQRPGSVPPRANVSKPTTIGLPSPFVEHTMPMAAPPVAASQTTMPFTAPQSPDLFGMSAPPPTPLSRPPVPLSRPPRPIVEELSDSALLDDASARESGQFTSPLHPPTPSYDDEPIVLPKSPLHVLLEDLKGLREGRAPKNKVLVGIAGGAVLLVAILLLVGIVSLASGGSSKTTTTSASASASAKGAPSSVAMPVTAPVTAVVPPTPSDTPKMAVLGDCSVAGDARSIAPRAVISSAIEAQAIEGGLVLGFAPSPRDVIATTLDPATLAATSTVHGRATGGDVRRVTPMTVTGKLAAMADVDRRGDRLTPRRVVAVPAATAATSLIDVGAADGAIVWAPHGKDSFAKLFPLEGDSPVEALRAISLGDRKGIAVTFRRDNAIHIGIAKGDSMLEASGTLSRIEGLGQAAGTLGSPSIATTGDQIVVAWADRTGPSDDWKVRFAKLKVGGSVRDAAPFAVPSGGLGGQAMSPSVASLGGGRFVLAWTEGPVSSHQVRAVTIGADGTPSGAAMTISAAGDNAGQPAVVVGSDGRGAVAFLAAKGKALEVHATPIACGK